MQPVKDLEQHKKMAVLIDADNAQLSKLPLIIEELSSYGHVVVKRAYGDWSVDSLKNWKNVLNELAIQPIQQFAYTKGKNATDASMIIDAMDLLYSQKFDAFALVSSDSDFTKLASRLRESEIYVFGVGEKKTPVSFRNACDDFLFTENLEIVTEIPEPEAPKVAEVPEIVKLLNRAWEHLQDEQGWAPFAQAGSFLKRTKPDFDPRTYGAKKFSELLLGMPEYFQVKKGPKGQGYLGHQPVAND